MSAVDSKLTRIGVFYDGNFFFHVSNYYQYHHSRRSRISVAGLHDFVRAQVAANEGVDVKYCQIVDTHYFRGRLRAQEAEQRGALLRERAFDDVLMREGVVTHYLPLRANGEMGIDVWLALEAYELAIYKRFDVSVLIAGDGDFLPLVRKLNTLGTRVMLLAWDFKFIDQNQQERETRTAQVLLDEVTYPVMMHQVIDDRSLKNDQTVNSLFMPAGTAPFAATIAAAAVPAGASIAAAGGAATTSKSPPVAARSEGTVKTLKEGYGFIAPTGGGTNVFFYHSELITTDFNDLAIGDRVTYQLGQNSKGPCAVHIDVLAKTVASAV